MSVPSWVKDAVFYQIFPDRFCNGETSNDPENVEAWGTEPSLWGFQGGDLKGISQKLDYLVELGINAIYLNPIFHSTSTHRYDTVDYYKIDPKLGNMEDFHVLIKTAHEKGIKVVLDGVFNHTGRGFFAFVDIMDNGEHSPYKNWYHIHKFPVDAYSSGDAVNFDGWWRFKSLPKLNTDHPPVREYIFSVAEYWIELGADGWRLDVPNEIDDDDFWEEFRRRVKKINPDAFIMGEIWEANPRWVNDSHFDSLMNYALKDALIDFLNKKISGKALEIQINHLKRLYPEEHNFAMYNLLGSHDTERIITYLNDQIDLVKMAYLFMFSMPGAPAIYYGDEIGLKGGKDPQCRRAFNWNPESWHAEINEWLRSLIKIRKDEVILRNGRLEELYSDNESNVFGFARIHEEKSILALFNAENSIQSIDVNVGKLGIRPGRHFSNMVGIERSYQVDINGALRITIPARSGLLLSEPKH